MNKLGIAAYSVVVLDLHLRHYGLLSDRWPRVLLHISRAVCGKSKRTHNWSYDWSQQLQL